MIFQSYALWPHMTVTQNVAYGLELRKIDRETINRKLDAILGHHAPDAARRPLSGRALRAASSSASRSRAR